MESKDKKTTDDIIVFDEQSPISKEEQGEILKEIEKVSQESKISVSPSVFNIKALKSGILFPILANVIIFVILALGIGVLFIFNQQRKVEFNETQTVDSGAEAILIEELKKQAEKDLLEKNKEIESIMANLDQISQERQDLEKNINEKISEKEEELRLRMEAELEQEKQALQNQGFTQAEIDAKLRDLEQSKTAAFNQQMNVFRQQQEQEKQALEENYAQAQQEYQTNLSALNQERNKILADAQAEENRLKQQLAEKEQALQEEKKKTQTELSQTTEELNQAEQELQRLAEIKKQQETAVKQLIGFYERVEQEMEAENYNKALSVLEEIKTFLRQESIINLPGIADRRNTDFFVIASLEDLVESKLSEKQSTANIASLTTQLEILNTIKSLVTQGDNRLAAGDNLNAEKFYKQALAQLPEIQRSHSYFLSQNEESESDQREALNERLQNAENAYDRGNYSTALSNYALALEYLPQGGAEIQKIVSQIQESGYYLGRQDEIKNQSTRAATQLAGADQMFTQSRYDAAIDAYIKLIAAYPQSEQASAALNGITKCVQAKSKLTNSEYNQQIDTLEASLQSQIEQVQALENEKAELSGQNETLADQNKDLTGQNEELSAQYKNAAAQNKGLLAQIDTLTKQVEAMGEVPDIQEVEDTQDTVTYDQGDLSDADQQEISRLKSAEIELKSLKSLYSRYTQREDTILEQKGVDNGVIESRIEYSRFLTSTDVTDTFPGLYQRVRMYEQAWEKEALGYAYDTYAALAQLSTSEEKLNYLNEELQTYASIETYSAFLQGLINVIKG